MRDMRQLVREHCAQFVRGQELQDAGRRRDSRMLWVASGRERIGLRLVDEINLRHRQPGARSELRDGVVELRRGGRVDFPSAIELEHHRVGKPVGPQIDAKAKEESQQHALSTAQHSADHAKKRHDRSHQKPGLEPVSQHCSFSPVLRTTIGATCNALDCDGCG